MLERVYENLELEDLIVNGEAEQWVQINRIKGLSEVKDYYWISNFGRVKSIGGRKDKILKQSGQRNGYLYIDLMTSDGKRKGMLVHRLVAFAFVEKYSKERNQTNHINEVKTDNRASNLNWMTAKENANHGTRNKRVAEKRSMPVVGECVKTGKVIEFESIKDAERSGFHSGNVSSACRGELSSHCKHGGTDVFKGYRWKYKKEENV